MVTLIPEKPPQFYVIWEWHVKNYYGLSHVELHSFASYFQQLNDGKSISQLYSGVMILFKVQLCIILWVQYPRHLFSNVNWIKSDCFAPALTSVSTWWPIQGKQRCVTKNILIKKNFFFFFWKKLLMVREEEFAWCFTELSSESLLRGPRAKRHGTEFSLEEKWICVH